MIDLTIITAEMCVSIDGPLTANVNGYTQTGLFSERHWPTCNCPAYKFRRNGTTDFGGRISPNPCKHIEQAQSEACAWHEQYSGESQKESGICPRCGDNTITVNVAV